MDDICCSLKLIEHTKTKHRYPFNASPKVFGVVSLGSKETFTFQTVPLNTDSSLEVSFNAAFIPG